MGILAIQIFLLQRNGLCRLLNRSLWYSERWILLHLEAKKTVKFTSSNFQEQKIFSNISWFKTRKGELLLVTVTTKRGRRYYTSLTEAEPFTRFQWMTTDMLQN